MPVRFRPESRPREIVEDLYLKIDESEDRYLAGHASFAEVEQLFDELDAELTLRWLVEDDREVGR
jgi:hypothetical protein